MVNMAPVAAAAVAMPTLTLNLWLAAKIAATSGRLHRPWPDLRTTTLPPMTLAALCVAIAFCFSGGLIALLAKIVTSALMLAYAFTGFAVLHTLTLAVKSRAFWLGSTYSSSCCSSGRCWRWCARARRCRVRPAPTLPAQAGRRRCLRPDINPSTSQPRHTT